MQVRSAEEVWEAALGELQIQVNKSNYRTWFRKTVGISYQDGQFVIGVPNTFIAEYLDRNQRSLIEKTLIGLVKRDIKVVFKINNGHQNSSDAYITQEETPPAVQTDQPRFNPKYTFDSFIIGNSNRPSPV